MEKTISIIKLFILLAGISILVNCNQKPGSNEESINKNQQQTDKSLSASEDYYIIKMAGQEVGKVSVSGAEIKFIIKGIEYQSKLNGDKRKYAVKSGDIIAEVKYKDDAFKVRKPNGDLLWKIKLYDDKVKISNNEENQNGYEVKLSDTDKIKLKKAEETLGEAKLKDGGKMIEITSPTKSFTIENKKMTMAYGVLLIDEIPENIQYIIMAELIAKGK